MFSFLRGYYTFGDIDFYSISDFLRNSISFDILKLGECDCICCTVRSIVPYIEGSPSRGDILFLLQILCYAA